MPLLFLKENLRYICHWVITKDMAAERDKKGQLTGVADDRPALIINRTLLLHTLTKTAFAASLYCFQFQDGLYRER